MPFRREQTKAHERFMDFAEKKWGHRAAMAEQGHGHRMTEGAAQHGFNMSQDQAQHGFNIVRDTHQNELGADWRDFQKGMLGREQDFRESSHKDTNQLARERLNFDQSAHRDTYGLANRASEGQLSLEAQKFMGESGKDIVRTGSGAYAQIDDINPPDTGTRRETNVDPRTGNLLQSQSNVAKAREALRGASEERGPGSLRQGISNLVSGVERSSFNQGLQGRIFDQNRVLLDQNRAQRQGNLGPGESLSNAEAEKLRKKQQQQGNIAR